MYVHVYIYIYIYISLCVQARIYIYIYIYTNFIKYNRHFLSTYFLLDLFVLPYCFYRIRQELIYVLPIVVCILSTFCPTLGNHQGRIYYKSDVTFVFAYYYYVRASLPLCVCVNVNVCICTYICACMCVLTYVYVHTDISDYV